MTFDTTTIVLIVVALIAVAVILMLLLRPTKPRRVEPPRPEGESPYVARQDRPYMKPPEPRAEPQPTVREQAEPAARRQAEAEPAPAPAPQRGVDGPQGNSVADEYATAATDVAGDVLGVEARAELPGATASPDDLQLLKGVGPKFAARLNELGITRFDQIASLNDNEVGILDGKLGPFRGRLARDRIVEQARYLARGDIDGFEEKFGKLGG